MQLTIQYAPITELFRRAHAEGRDCLLEHEVYALLGYSGAETPPRHLFLSKEARPVEEACLSLPGDKAVLKIVSPYIVHKTELGGVRIIPKTMDKIRSTVRRMLCEVPERYAEWLERHPQATPPVYRGLSGAALQNAVSRDIRGVLQVRFMPPDSTAFGNELIVGLRRTREFGMVLSAGLGGTDAELYAERFRKGQAVAAAPTALTDGQAFFDLFRATVSYRKLAGLTRGQQRIVTDEQLIECFESFIRLGNHYSPLNDEAPFVIDELEINPFSFSDFLMTPLDGMCRFSLPQARDVERPWKTIHQLLHPRSIGIAGVSARRRNYGRIILENILAAGFSPSAVRLVRPGGGTDESGVACVSSLADLPEPLDLFIVAVGAPQVPGLVDDVLRCNAARSVMLIPGGMGETEASRDEAAALAARMAEAHRRPDGGPVFLGANCMGVISRPGNYDTWFIPAAKLRQDADPHYRRVAIFSQSGAFLLNRYSQTPELRPAYLISLGNQTDLSLGDMMRYFRDSDAVDVIAVYVEGFRNLDGLAFAGAVREAVCAGKQVIFYKAGRTPEGKSATSGHTASLAGDYMVCESCLRQSGAIVARTFDEFQDLILLADAFGRMPIRGTRLGAVSGAGFEAVGMADNIQSEEYAMTLGTLTEETRAAMRELLVAKKLDKLATVANPLDINPGADDETHARMAELMLADDTIDAVAIGLDPLSPVTHSLADSDDPLFRMDAPDGILARLEALRRTAQKPLVAVVDGGALFEPLRRALRERDIPTFPVCDRAVAALSLYMDGRLAAEGLRCSCPWTSRQH
ncbi:MAG: acetate--CoA ligase family protein [Desulfovibrio sp.]|uniref:acetate--CoA ligase family protein n=1 Tax=Desulfovibrio sp. TaxID=885 RepID=UPI0025C03370|nr:acetate--CoA ligase family protein [Desulfovibrio sp.]MCI7568451.1 acetate--CoA ligase family protein [Desulfovibrio sp.]